MIWTEALKMIPGRLKLFSISLGILAIALLSALKSNSDTSYASIYRDRLSTLRGKLLELSSYIESLDSLSQISERDKELIRTKIHDCRRQMKALDFWLRYLEPLVYKKLNGPLPVEWETEVFEKFEKPYKREGSGLSLAEMALEEEALSKKELRKYIQDALTACNVFGKDSIQDHLKDSGHFLYCNRLYLLNLASIYSSGFECPDTSVIIKELKFMCRSTEVVYNAYFSDFRAMKNEDAEQFLVLYKDLGAFLDKAPDNYEQFDHFTFISKYVEPLFSMNQKLIRKLRYYSGSVNDYSLNRLANSLFDKDLYFAQNGRGIYGRVDDPFVLKRIATLGELLFNDPILSGNNQRACASCHKPSDYFTDHQKHTALQFNKSGVLERNTPGLANVSFQHLLMIDGKHLNMQEQVLNVLRNTKEMNSKTEDVLNKVLSCRAYKNELYSLLPYTPLYKKPGIDHILSAVSTYVAGLGNYISDFDRAMKGEIKAPEEMKSGFNLFMSKAKCASCHFIPQFNGVKPPFTGSEFEVIGVPSDSLFKALSPDSGRYKVFQADEMLHAFRTPTLRNIHRTGPYMHNGVFRTLGQVLEFYNQGGGAGKGLTVKNQTLSSDSLGLSKTEISLLLKFMTYLNEDIPVDQENKKLPESKMKFLNSRKFGGEY
jgi:cytochrome c peroxidase